MDPMDDRAPAYQCEGWTTTTRDGGRFGISFVYSENGESRQTVQLTFDQTIAGELIEKIRSEMRRAQIG
ncbi:MAG: hypothetical protein HZA68_07650 [Rhodovulum sp.]|nr:hypothetical protein [Rhodovulum sp.]